MPSSGQRGLCLRVNRAHAAVARPVQLTAAMRVSPFITVGLSLALGPLSCTDSHHDEPTTQQEEVPDASTADCPQTSPPYNSACPEVGMVCTYDSLSFGMVCADVAGPGPKWAYVQSDADAACPADVPPSGTPCPGAQTCSYERQSKSCSQPLASDAECDPETHRWHVWSPAYCGEWPANTPCDPLGAWVLAFDFERDDAGTASPSCGSAVTSVLAALRIRDDVTLQARDLESVVDPETCAWQLSWSTGGANYSENWSDSYELELTVDETRASGSISHQAHGFCSGSEQGTAMGSRPAP